MKRLLILLFAFFPFVSFGQSEVVNGNLTVKSSIKFRKTDDSGTAGLDLSGDGKYIHIAGNGLISRNNNVQDLGLSGWRFRNLWLGNNAFINGKVSIGTNTLNPNFLLLVNGKVKAKEVVVETDWADFVFFESYQLTPLKEVEVFIDNHGHLEGIPNAEEVRNNGISIGEIQSKFLQKIEELTLYAIDQQKQIDVQREEISFLKSQIEELKSILKK